LPVNEKKDLLKQAYEEWMISNGFSISRPTNHNTYCETVYNHPNGAGISIVQLNDGTDKIIITTRVNFGPDIQIAFVGLPHPDQMKLINDISLLLMQIGVQFNILSQASAVQSIIVERTIYGENITKQLFFDCLSQVINGALVILMKVQERFGGQNSRSSASSTLGSPAYG
jgi:hypothetical protein